MTDENKSECTMEDHVKEGARIWVVLVNSDLTEGKGHEVIKAVCETESVALRIAEGASTQGSNGRVLSMPSFQFGGRLYGPIELERPGGGDIQFQKHMDARRAALDRAREAGVSEEDLELLHESKGR